MAVLTASLETFPEGTRDPEKGVDTEEGECTNQQAGHRPERIEQEGILLPVMMGGMGQVTGKFTVRAGVALLAGCHHIAPVEL